MKADYDRYPRVFRPGVLLALLAPLLLGGFSSFDFEQPYFLEDPEVQCKDHAVIKHEGLYHVFYIQSLPPSEGGHWRRERWLGHISSPDLRHWSRHDSILHVIPDSWESRFIWAPKIIRNPQDDSWVLYYTGTNTPIAQQTGGAKSADLYTWTRFPENPVYHPGEWACWDIDEWANCRDPEIYHKEGEKDYYMLNTAMTADSLGAVSLAKSEDLVYWEDLGALFTNENYRVMESVQLVNHDGWYHLLYTEQGRWGTRWMRSSDMLTGWDKDDEEQIDPGHAPEISDLGDELLFSRHNGIPTENGPVYYYEFDQINFDTFDGKPEIRDLGGFSDLWIHVFGDAFQNQPTWGDNPLERGDGPSGMVGNSYVATYEDFAYPDELYSGSAQGVEPIGLIRSQSFTVSGDRMSLLVGGGQMADLEFVGLVRGSTDRMLFIEEGSGSHAMNQRLWNLETLLGETVYLVVADLAADGDGFISCDEIEEYDRAGDDPFTPSDPWDNGPLLDDIISQAGFTSAPEDAPSPPSARLLPAQPNPFNPRTRLRYELTHAAHLDLGICDAGGRQVRRLHDGDRPAGPGFFTWDGLDDRGRAQPSGVYFARLVIDGRLQDAAKLVLVR